MDSGSNFDDCFGSGSGLIVASKKKRPMMMRKVVGGKSPNPLVDMLEGNFHRSRRKDLEFKIKKISHLPLFMLINKRFNEYIELSNLLCLKFLIFSY